MRFLIVIFLTILINVDSLAQNVGFNKNLGLDYRLLDFVSQVKLFNNSYREKYIGSFFLFDDWTNNCQIQLSGKQFKLNNVNVNVDTNEFMLETGKDSVFSIDSKHIDFVNIKNKKFVYKTFAGQNKFFEALLETEDKLSLYKGFDIRILPKSEMGMLNRPYDEIKKDEKYFISKGGNDLITIRLKKKEILNHMEKNKHGKVLKYVKERKLSFKKEKDLKEIFKYYNTI